MKTVGVFVGEGSPASNFASIKNACGKRTVFQLRAFGAAHCSFDELQRFSAIIFPGGSGSTQANSIGSEGRRQIRQFVTNGGGYFGICGGAFLAAACFPWSLGLLNANVLADAHDTAGSKEDIWYRGGATNVLVEISEEGRSLLKIGETGLFPSLYHNGPILSGGTSKTLPNFKELAHFRSEISRTTRQVGTMVNSPAIVASPFGHGRVAAASIHLEASKATHTLVIKIMDWLCDS